MSFGIILLVLITPSAMLAQQGSTAIKPGDRFAGDLYAGLGKEMYEAYRIWDGVNRAFDSKYRASLTSSTSPGRSPVCDSPCKEDLEQVRRAHEAFVRKKILFYEQHLREATQTIEDRKRRIARQRERISNLELAFKTERGELDSLQEQSKALDAAPGGGGERVAETRRRLLTAIDQQRDIAFDLQESRNNADAVLDSLLRGVVDANDFRDQNRRDITSINANNEYWQSHYDLRAAQFDLLCPQTPPPPPLNPRPN